MNRSNGEKNRTVPTESLILHQIKRFEFKTQDFDPGWNLLFGPHKTHIRAGTKKYTPLKSECFVEAKWKMLKIMFFHEKCKLLFG